MRYLFYLLRKHYFYFLFIFLEVISLIWMFSSSAYQGGEFAGFTNNMAGSVQMITTNVYSYFSLKKKNRMLSEDNAKLHSNLPSAFYRIDTNTFFYHDSLHKLQYEYISARVISNSVNKRNNFLMLEKGTNEGIRDHMGVIIGNRVVGQVVSVSQHFSWVMSMLNKDSRISGKFKKNNQLVNIEWSGRNYRYGDVKEIPKHVKISIGDTIITSGNSDIFPEGMMIGTISEFIDATDENFNRATLLFSTDFNSLSYVEVIIDLMRKEKEELKSSFKSTE